jgi:hypothetical protein
VRHPLLAERLQLVAQAALDERAHTADAGIEEDGADERLVRAGEVRGPPAAAGRIFAAPELQVLAQVEARRRPRERVAPYQMRA